MDSFGIVKHFWADLVSRTIFRGTPCSRHWITALTLRVSCYRERPVKTDRARRTKRPRNVTNGVIFRHTHTHPFASVCIRGCVCMDQSYDICVSYRRTNPLSRGYLFTTLNRCRPVARFVRGRKKTRRIFRVTRSSYERKTVPGHRRGRHLESIPGRHENGVVRARPRTDGRRRFRDRNARRPRTSLIDDR